MCTLDKTISLSESKNAQITWCKCCRYFSLAYNSCCSTFTEEQLEEFKSVLYNLEDYDFKFYFIGDWHVILRTSPHSTGFCLKMDDVDQLTTMITKAQNMYEAFSIIYAE